MTKKQQQANASATQLKENEKKWTKPLMDAGWTVVPDVIIQRQQALGLDPLDVNILLHLASRWWKAEGKPYPSKTSIAKATGMHPRTIQKRIAAMEAIGFVRREQRRIKGRGSETNVYHLDGLIEAATPYAQEIIESRKAEKARRERAAAKKGKPKLKVISGGADE